MPPTEEQLLAEFEDLLRTMPPLSVLREETADNFAWMGRASAVLSEWDQLKAISLHGYFADVHAVMGLVAFTGYRNIAVLLHQARHALRMKALGPASVAIAQGMVFDYFDEIRKIIEAAKQDLLFIDPYLDAEFVSRYLGHVGAGVAIRLLTREKLAALLPAVDAFVQQTKTNVQVPSAPNFHDRYVFVDQTECYQSGASFKDGAKRAPTTLTQITDAFTAMFQAYEDMWKNAKVER